MNEPTEQLAPTPRSDEAIFITRHNNAGEVVQQLVHVEFVRGLERELATERAAREYSDTLREELRAKYHQVVDEKNEWRAVANAERAACESADYMGNILAIIHCDGGHYKAEHGTVKATDDAIEIVSGLKAEVAELKERLQNVLDDAHAQWMESPHITAANKYLAQLSEPAKEEKPQ